MAAGDSRHLDDILFSLRATGAISRDGDWDAGTVASVLAAVDDFARGPLAAADAVADREGCRLVAGRVRVPARLEEAYAAFVARGLHLAGLPAANGGLGAPAAVLHAATELLTAHGHAFQMLVALVPGGVKLIREGLPPERADALLADLATGGTLVTMAMTEPGAGSDLSAIVTRATRDGGGWRIDGNKIFISGGDQSMTPDILHFVLARTGERDGRAELSLFAVRSRGGDRNGVSVRRLEEKAGLHASPTCDVAFDDARAELIGQPGEGLRRMFALMNHARLDVALQAVGHAARVTGLAAAYAMERRQGRSGDGRQVAIATHGDVRRMLADMQASTPGLRAMCHLAAGLGEADGVLTDLVTPVCKAFCTDEGQRVLDLGLQIHGGYGYLRDYAVERHWRDCRVTQLYEGTNGIHAMTLVGRALRADGAADAFASRAASLVAGASTDIRSRVLPVVDIWREASVAVLAHDDPGAAAGPFLRLTGLVWYLSAWSCLEAHAAEAAAPTRIRSLAKYAVADAGIRARDLADGVARYLQPDALPEM